MTKADDEHFDSYRLQTRIKHAILEGYLPAYFNVIKKYHKNLVFIDGFAGRGYYKSNESESPGSPLRALDIVARNAEFSKRVQCVMIEKSDEYCEELTRRVTRFHAEHPEIKKPLVICGRFSEKIDELLGGVDGGKRLAPTFLFVDPCGVDDVSMSRVTSVLSQDYCEAFVFFNLDGIRRIAGLAASNGEVSPTLVDLYGSPQRARLVVSEFQRLGTVDAREACLVANYQTALRDVSNAKFVLPLRVEGETRKVTSHYLLHATKHELGFKIMKEVMWKSGGFIECEGERLALQQASRSGGPRLFRPDLDALDNAIEAELRSGPKSVGLFRDDWVRRPEDMFSSGVYRERLLALEESGRLVVLDEDGTTVLPPNKRRVIKGVPTMAERLFVRLP